MHEAAEHDAVTNFKNLQLQETYKHIWY